MTALRRTLRTIRNAKRAGFQWRDWVGPLRKVKEELRELEQEIRRRSKTKARISEEIGDLLFSVCNLATLLKLDPEKSLNATLDKFQSRFRFVAAELKKKGRSPKESNLKEMGSLWRKAKTKSYA
jgi:uncharacterized protein YabN with tetrapyrrole methylase and pyrophosphatase domain